MDARIKAVATSDMAMSNFPSLNHIAMISPRPILLITGDIAHSRAFSETAFAAAAEPKELYIVEGARHIDLYDNVDKIPFDKLESFFKESLNMRSVLWQGEKENYQKTLPNNITLWLIGNFPIKLYLLTVRFVYDIPIDKSKRERYTLQ